MPFITSNAQAAQNNAVEIAEINSDIDHIDITLSTLDNSIARLDEKIDKLNLILCDVSSGVHC